MKRYWIRIALAAMGIFVVGMLVVGAGRRGVERVKQIASQHTLNITPGVAPFQVDNRRLGTLTEVEMDPEASQGFPFMNLTVQLDSGLEVSGLNDCLILAGDAESLQDSRGLHCSGSISQDSLVKMGNVTFAPSGEVLGLFVPIAELAGQPWFHRGPRVTRVGKGATNEGSFSLQAGAAGAFMLIKDDKGRPIFQLNADSQGAYIQIRDSNGTEVVRFRADSQGVKGVVH